MFAIVLQSVTGFSQTQLTLIPLILAALLVDAAIVTIWYMFGYVLGNPAVRQSARSEFYQLIGTAILIAIITFALVTFGGFFQTTLNNTKLLSQTAISSMCSSIEAEAASGTQTPIGVLSSGGFSALLCPVVGGTATDYITSEIDYPLAASGVVLENLTYQSATNINSFFVVDSFIGFLAHLAPTFGICIDSIPNSWQCITPIPEPPPAFFLSVSYTPYAGFSFLFASMASLGILLTSSLYSFIIQLSFITIFLFVWPYLIFVGLLLRSNFITRKLGGLFIAVAIGAVFFYPVIFAIQYLTLGNGLGNLATFGNVFSGPGSISSIYGFNGLPSSSFTYLPENGCGSQYTSGGSPQCPPYIPNFYVFPSVQTIANYYYCWPPNGNTAGALDAEAADIAFFWIPGAPLYDVLSAMTGSFVSSIPVIYLPYQCGSLSQGSLLQQQTALIFAYVDMYAIYGVSGYLLPILDILITLSAILGLSSLLGGDTSLAGLSRLI